MANKKKLKSTGTAATIEQSVRVKATSFSMDESSGSSQPSSPAPRLSKKTSTELVSEPLIVDLSLVKIEPIQYKVPQPTVMLDITGSTTVESIVKKLVEVEIMSPKRRHDSESSTGSTESPAKLIVTEEMAANDDVVEMEATAETEEFKNDLADCKKFPIFNVDSEKSKSISLDHVTLDSGKSKSNSLDPVTECTVVNSTVGKSSEHPLENNSVQDSSATYSDVAQEGANRDLDLFIHWGQTVLAPLAFASFSEFKQALAVFYAGEVMEGKVGRDINCGRAWYDRDNKCAVIKCENVQSVAWFKKSVLLIRVREQCFRAWSFGERPELFRMRLFLPETYDKLDRHQIRAMIAHFNPEAKDILNLVGWEPAKRGRSIKLEAGPNFFEYCRRRGGKLSFLLGDVDCVVSRVAENLTSKMEVETNDKPTKELNGGINADSIVEPSKDIISEPSLEPVSSQMSPASLNAVDELLSEAESRSREERSRRSSSITTNRSNEFIPQNRNHFSSRRSTCSTPLHERSSPERDQSGSGVRRRRQKTDTSSPNRSISDRDHDRDRSHQRDPSYRKDDRHSYSSKK